MLHLLVTTILFIAVCHKGITDCARIRRNANFESGKNYGPWRGNAMYGNILTTNKLNSYPKAPAEAFFGKGVHTHSFVHRSNWIEYEKYLLGWPAIGRFPAVDVDHMEITRFDNFLDSHSIGGIDDFAKRGNITWTPAITKYDKELNKSLVGLGVENPRVYSTPEQFFGHSIDSHDLGALGSTNPHAGWDQPYRSVTYGLNGTSRINQEFQPYKKQFEDNRRLMDSVVERNPFEVDETKYFSNIPENNNNDTVIRNHNPFLGKVNT